MKVCVDTYLCDMTRRVGYRDVRDTKHSDISEGEV